MSPDRRWSVSGSQDHTVRIWDLEMGACRATLKGHKGDVRTVAITPDGKWVLSGTYDKTIRVWDASIGRHLRTWVDHKGVVWVLRSRAMVEGLFRLAGMVGDTALRVWDLNTGKCERRLQGHEAGALYGVAVTEDGQRALSG